MKAKLGCLITILFFTFYASTQQAFGKHNQADSMLTLIKQAKGVEKLKLLDKHVSLFLSNPDLIVPIEEMAIKEKDHLFIAYAYRFRIYGLSKKDENDSIRFYLNLMDEELTLYEQNKKHIAGEEKTRYRSIKSTLATMKVEQFLMKGLYDLALVEINEMLSQSKLDNDLLSERQAYVYLGMMYVNTEKWDKALLNFQEAYAINEVMLKANKPKLSIYSYFPSMEGILLSNEKLGQHKQAIVIADSLLNRIERDFKSIETPNNEDLFLYYYCLNRVNSLSALSFMKTNQLKEARMRLDKIKQFIREFSNTPHSNFMQYYKSEAEYHLLTKNFPEARQYIQVLLENISLETNPQEYLEINILKAKILNAEGDNLSAYNLINQVHQAYDSISKIDFSSRVAEIQTIHQVEKAGLLAKQSEEKLQLTQIILIILALVFLLSLGLLYQSWRNGKVLKKKNQQLHHQYTKIEESNKLMHKLKTEKLNEGNVPASPYDDIIIKLKNYLDESQIYRNADLSREELALKIGTNRQYLIQAIKEKTGHTFNEFIYEHRLKYAYDMIVKERDKSISDVYVDSGFANRSTFNKAFKGVYGMSPTELRNIL